MIPYAQMVHSTSQRLRLRIAGRRGDQSYFTDLAAKLKSAFTDYTVQANALTGSVIFFGKGLDGRAVADFGQKEDLFVLKQDRSQSQPLSISVIAPLQAVDRHVKAVTSGRLDLAGSLFVGLLLFGIVEIIRGNWKSPPWYTAFWYAFGLYSKTLFDQVAGLGDADA